MIVSEIFIYPVKSLAGCSMVQAPVVATGFESDRSWMVVDEFGQFLTQRQLPKMCLITAELREQVLELAIPEQAAIQVPLIDKGHTHTAQVWNSTCQVVDQGDQAARALSRFLGRSCRLVRMAPGFRRPIKERYQQTGAETISFVDSMPFLLTSEASLADLNARLVRPVGMNRFRPNIVVSGVTAFAEDGWKRLRIGQVVFRVVKGCERCEIITVEQETGIKGTEPLECLGSYRTGPKGIMFGQHLVAENLGRIARGDTVEILA